MAGMFYSLQEVAKKLNKTEEEVKQIVKAGKLREFRDGPNLLFKVDEVEALMSDKTQQQTEAEEISLAPETAEGSAAPSELTEADTIIADEEIDILEETGGEHPIAEDTMGETKAASDEMSLASSGEAPSEDDTMGETKATSGEVSLEEIEEDVNLDTFGSGSGLLDLSLQADDTSLGGILDEIYTPQGEQAQETPAAGSAMEVAADAEQMLAESGIVTPQPDLEAPPVAQAYIEPEPDTLSNALGFMLFVPLLVIIYTTIVAVAGRRAVMPAILESIQGVIWYVMGGLAVVAILIVGIPLMFAAKPGKASAKKKPKARKKKAGKASAPPPQGEIA